MPLSVILGLHGEGKRGGVLDELAPNVNWGAFWPPTLGFALGRSFGGIYLEPSAALELMEFIA